MKLPARLRPAAALAGTLLVLAGAACASARAARLREDRLRRELDAFVYPKPVDAVWPEVCRLLAGRGYPLAGKDAEAAGVAPMPLAERILSPARETGPVEGGLLQRLGKLPADVPGAISLDTGWTRFRERVHAEGRPDGAGCRIVLWRLKEDQDRRAEERRDLELELDLLGRVAPEAAASIRARLDAPPP